MRVEVFFTDREGRRWKVYDWSLICGHKYRRSPGEQCAECRGFLDEMSGERRVYRFKADAESRLQTATLLARQLEESLPVEPPAASRATPAATG